MLTGEQCDISTTERLDTCPAHLCKAPSVCTPLISGGFRCEVCDVEHQTTSHDGEERRVCEECAHRPHHNSYCELRTRSFEHGNFLLFPALRARHRFVISLW